MQLKPKVPPPKEQSARRRLMAASCALLSAGAARSQQSNVAPVGSGLLEDWSVDTALAYYHEDGRIHAIEPVVDLAKVYADGKSLNLNMTFDALSGASPNGALTSRSPQTFASPSGTSLSGSHSYTIAPGQLPADPNYHDDRLAAGASWTVPVTRVTQLSVGGKLSDEHDFLSVTGNASIGHDFNEKNTTLLFGVDDEYDSLKPIGGAPVPGSDYALFQKTGNKNKNGVGALLGVTQVITRSWLSELNISADRFTGYLNDPYKIISIIDNAGNTTGYQYESRPDSRTRKSAYWDNRIAWTSQVSTDLSFRYFTDDWGVRSDTAQLHLRWSLDNRDHYVEPSFRWYRQTAADFYAPFISNTAAPSTANESADSRLGPFHALTFGLKYSEQLADQGSHVGSEFSARVEYYRQTFDETKPVPAGLQGLDLYPGLKAILVQIGWRF